jgi:DNA primase (bacterial type)
MNIEQAKQIRIEDYLHSLGIEPIKVSGENLWYLSPLRNEKTPSFKVNNRINLWYDFGNGENGNIIDLVMKMNKTSSVSEALHMLDYSLLNNSITSFSFRQQEHFNGMGNISIKLLTHSALLDYLTKRNISINIALKYCKEIHSKVGDKTYFAIGFLNSNGGYEIRNNYFKGCIPPKAITHIKQQGTQRDTCYLFEGFMDFLSFLTIREQINPQYPRLDTRDYMVLNSITNLSKAEDLLTQYEKIHCFLDNDKAGKDAYKKLELKFKHKVQDASAKYSNYKDLNDYLCGNEWRESIQKQSQVQSAKQIEPPRKTKGFRL